MLSNDNSAIRKMRDFFNTEKFMLIVFAIACLITLFKIEVIGVLIFILIISFLLVVCDDLMPTTLPFLLLCETVIKLYDSYNIFIKLLWFAVPVVSALIFHFIYYKRKIVIGSAFKSMLFVSAAVTLGGCGFISKEAYFSLVSFYYVFGLGFGMLFIYVLLCTYLNTERTYSLKDKLSDTMIYMGLFAVYMIIEFYLANIPEVMQTKGIIYMQWRNNISTYLMLAMPFVAFKAIKRPSYIFLALLFYCCILLAGSRGGLVFGGIELLMTMSILIGLDKRHRWTFISIGLGIVLAIALFFEDFYGFFGATFDRLIMGISGAEKEVRLQLFERAFQDFNNNPIFGTGLAYMGNRDVHPSAKFALCWYHCEPLQIMGSLGVVGIIAYVNQLFERFVILLKKKTIFNITVLVSYVGLEMMSLVNPGIFCPLPYLFLIILMLAIVEQVNKTENVKSLENDIQLNQVTAESTDEEDLIYEDR